MTSIIIFILLATLSYFGVSYFCRIAWKYQILDKPNERSSHSKPIPLGGGLAIVLIVLATGAWVAYEIDWRRSLIYIVSASIMAWMGWRDDVHSLPAVFRLVVQGLIAIASTDWTSSAARTMWPWVVAVESPPSSPRLPKSP